MCGVRVGVCGVRVGVCGVRVGVCVPSLFVYIATYHFVGNFKTVLSATSVHKNVPFNFNSNFVKLYFGEELDRELGYQEICQLLQVHPSHTHTLTPHTPSQSLPTEHARQAFIKTVSEGEGSISAEEYVRLMKSIRGFRLSPHVQDHLLAVSVLCVHVRRSILFHCIIVPHSRWLVDQQGLRSTMLISRPSTSYLVTLIL